MAGSNEIGEAFFHFPELADAEPEEKGGDAEAAVKSWPINPAFPAKDAPAEAINHADHGVQAVEEPPLFGHDGAAEADRRYIEPELDDEGDDVFEVAVFDIEGRDPERGAKAGAQCHGDEGGEQEYLPTGNELIPDHEGCQDGEADQKIHKGDNDGRGRNDEPGEIDFGDEVGVVREAVAGIAEGGGEKLPW